MNNNNREPPHLLTSLAVTRPRPHRSRKPSSPSTLSPSLSCSYGTRTSLFEDDYLAAFFPALSAAGTALAPDPSHATSTSTCENNGNSTDRCTLAVEEKINSDQCRTPSLASVEEAGGGERMEEVEGKEEKEKEENGVGADEEGKEDCVNASRSLEDDGDDGPFSGDETCGTATNGKKLLTKDRCNSPISPSSPCSPLCPHSPPPPLNPASPSNATSPRCTPSPRSPSMASSLPLSPSSATKRRPSSSSSSSSISSAYPLSPSSVSQRRPSSSSSSSSSTYDAGLPLASPALKTSEEDHLSIFVFPPKISRLGSIYSHLGLSCSDTDFPGAEGDECSLGSLQRDIPPCEQCKSPRRREGKIYASGSSHEGIPPGDAFPHKEVDEQQTDCGESGWDGAGASEGRGVPQHSSYSASTSLRPQRVNGAEGEWEQERKETRQAHSRPDVTHAAEGAVENETSVKIENQMYWKGSEAEEETDGNLMNKITEPSPSRPTEDIGKEEEGVKAKSKAPPAKPPRLGVKIRTRNGEDETRSSEDPVQYRTTDERQDLRMKKSASMDNILESNLQVSPKVKGSRLSESPAREVAVGILEAPLPEAWKGKKDKRTRHSVRREAKVVMAKLMAKKPPAAPHFERQKASRIMAESKKRAVLRDPQSSSLPPSPSSLSAATTATTTTTRHQEKCRDGYQPPNKPPRKNLQDTLGSGSIERTQATCSSHGAALNFYCVKCRVVVCRDCTVVAHSQTLNHKVLDTLDALATLRSEAVALLRHYTILSTMHTTLTDIYSKFKAQRPEMDTAAMCQRLEEGRYLAEVVKKAEEVVTNWTNIYEIKQRVEQWEARQQEWGDLVFLASRCALLADMHVPSDTVFLRMGSWVMPTPWIQLSHLLQPYLGTGTASNTSSSSTTSTSLSSSSSPSAKHLTSNTHRRGTDTPSPQVKRSVSPFGVTSSTGGTDQPFPYNARQVVLSNLVPYIILNPDVRYFVHIGGPRDVDLTLVVVPVEEHAEDYLKRRRNNATKTPALLRQSHYRPPVDAITMVEQQMTSGTAKTRITASSMSLGSAAALTIVKVSFSDVKVVSDGHGLPVAKGELRRGDVIIDQNASGKTMLTVAIRDIGDFPALRLGRVIHGMDGLICLVSTEDSRRAESSGLRAKIKATVKREEEAMYDVVFGMDL